MRLGMHWATCSSRWRHNDDGGVQPTYDLSVPANVTYVAAGFVSHNTIGLMMDCDTTGVEPDLALVKFKKLVGGGSMQIVNQTVPRALRSLGYQTEQIEAIVEYIAEHGHVVDAPGLRREHYEVFDCAMGERSIAPMGHVRMMAAVQPFISGAISKTVNMPEQATVDDVAEIYLQGWKMGLKALAIYRDNCKVGQPLSASARTRQSGSRTGALLPAVATEPGRPVRRRLPKKRPSQTVSFTVGGAEGYLTTGSYPDDGLGEVFIKLGKQGSTLAGVMDAFSIAVSVGLQYGIPLETYVAKFTNLRFEPAGMTDDPDVRIATSVMDYLFRRIALDYLPVDKRAELGIFTAAERAAQVSASYGVRRVAPSRTRWSKSSAPRWTSGSTVAAAQGRRAAGSAEATPARRSQVTAAPSGKAGSSTELLELVIGKAVRCPAVLHLRHQDAPVRCLLRLRGLRLHLRLQLTGFPAANTGPAVLTVCGRPARRRRSDAAVRPATAGVGGLHRDGSGTLPRSGSLDEEERRTGPGGRRAGHHEFHRQDRRQARPPEGAPGRGPHRLTARSGRIPVGARRSVRS